MRITLLADRPRVEALESRLQPGTVLEGTLNLPLLVGDLGLLSAGLFTSRDDAAAPSRYEAANSKVVSHKEDILARAPAVQQFRLEHAAPGIMESEEALAAIQNSLAGQTRPAIDGRNGNCIRNGDFETGDLSEWTLGDPEDGEVGVDNVAAFNGAFGAYLGTIDTYNTLSQVCDTAAKTYTVAFYLQNLKGGAGAWLLVTWGDEVLLYLENPASFTYRYFAFENVPTPGPQTSLVFYEQHSPDYWEVDDVAAVPS